MKKIFSLLGLTIILLSAPSIAVIPNGNFEAGTYANWTQISGTAFGLPTTNIFANLTSWEGTYYANSIFPNGINPADETAVGVLRSDTFNFSANYALSFLIGGASTHWGYTNTWVTLNLASDDSVIDMVLADANTPPLVRKYFDASAAYGQDVYIEIVDNGTNPIGWAWIAVDDFKFIEFDTNFDFENGYMNWGITGTAWGSGPSTTNFLPAASVGFGCHGDYFALSLAGGESATGTNKSSNFTLPKDSQLNFLICGWSSVASNEKDYNFVTVKKVSDDSQIGETVYAPGTDVSPWNIFADAVISNKTGSDQEVYIEAIDNADNAGGTGFAWFGVDYFQIKTPTPEMPQGFSASKGSTNDRVIVIWHSDAEATKYIVYRNTVADTNSASDISGELGDVTQFDDTTALNNSNYYYWVQAGNSYGWSLFSDYDTGFTTDSTGPDKPSNVSPADGAEPEFPISFTASAYSDSESWPFVTSEWHISSNVNFSSKIRIRTGPVTNIIPPNGDLYSGTNYWKVRYGSDRNKWSDWSDTTFFIVDRNLDSPFYFYETFNNVSGSGDVNKEYNVSGRQLGFATPLDYVSQGTTEVGANATNPNKLTLSGENFSCSPNFSFEDYSNFKIEFDLEPSSAGSAFSFGKETRNAAPNSIGGMSFVFYGNGNYDVYSSDSLLGSFNNEAVNKSSFHIMIKVSTPDFDNSEAQIALFADGQPLILLPIQLIQPFHTNHYNYVYEKSAGFNNNNITFYNSAGNSVFDNFEIQMAPNDNFNVYKWTDDSNSRIDSDYNYTHAVNFNTENNFDINGVTFIGTGTSPVYGLNPVGAVHQRFVASGTASVTSDSWQLVAADGLFETDSDWEAPPVYVASQGNKLLEHFLFSTVDGIQIKLDNLTPETSNTFVMHLRGWWGSDFEYQFAANDGSAPGLAPVELYGVGTGTVFEYRYKVPANGKFIFTLSNCGFPIYSFSNYELTNNIPPKLETLSSLNFGETVAGQTKTFKLPVFNLGAGTVSGIVTGADSQFEFLNGSTYSAQSESPDFVNISFTPSFEEKYSNTIYLTGSGGSTEIELKGIGVPEPISVIGYLLSIICIFILRRCARPCVSTRDIKLTN